MKNSVCVLDGGLAVDDRGEVSFVNGFDMKDVKRFYTVSNHKSGFIRAWHAHKKEAKYVMAVSGAAVIGAVKIDNWQKPSRDLPVQRHVISAKKPQLIYIPPGFANGFMSLTSDLKLVFFSTSTIEQSAKDDIRYDARYWDIWEVAER
ncbi:MAG: sugar epimerase [Planctomycetota bacterium]|nr:MAG: sugar epimerase [Planctomycetota bacterium]